MTDTAERIRFSVARRVDRLMPSMCWADLVTWALSSWRNPKRLIDCRRGISCQSDIDTNGSCWCGKIQRAGSTASKGDVDDAR